MTFVERGSAFTETVIVTFKTTKSAKRATKARRTTHNQTRQPETGDTA